MALNGLGVGGQIEVDDRFITIRRKGLLAKSAHGLKGEKRIPLSAVTAVQFKLANNLTNGYIQFSLSGGSESRRGLQDAIRDENTVMFHKKHLRDFEAIRDYVEARLGGSGQAAGPNAPDLVGQLERLAALRDSGVLTQGEFDAQKAKLLS